MQEYLTIKEVAEMLRCSTKTIRRYTKEGLRFHRAGRRLLFLRKDIEDFMKKGSGG